MQLPAQTPRATVSPRSWKRQERTLPSSKEARPGQRLAFGVLASRAMNNKSLWFLWYFVTVALRNEYSENGLNKLWRTHTMKY